MGLLQITKDIKKKSGESMVPIEGFEISKQEFLKSIEKYDCSINSRSYELEGKEFEYIVCNFNTKDLKRLSLTYSDNQIRISYNGRISDSIVATCSDIAEELKAYLLVDVNLEYPRSKALAARKRLSIKLENNLIEYQEESFGGNNMWLAIKSSFDQVVSFYELNLVREKPWIEAIEDMYSNQGIFLYPFRGWVFLAGRATESIFFPYPEGEESIEKHQVELLKKWGRFFSDIQLYMHYNKIEYFNAFYRVLNEKLLYGKYYTESYQIEYGTAPKNINDLPTNNANTIASDWSYDPDFLRYCEELKGAKAWIATK